MDTLYYRKIAEIVFRDEFDSELRSAALRVLSTGRAKADKIAGPDKRALKAWMHRWCDQHEPIA